MKQITHIQHVVLFFLALAVVSCKGTIATTTDVSSSLNPDERLAEVFEIQLKATVNYDDEFRIYYATKETTGFSENQVIRVKIVGLSEAQIITYKFPLGIYPSNFRIDFGFNKKQKNIHIDNLMLLAAKKQITIFGSELTDYFSLMEGSVEYDKEQKELKILSKDTHLPIIFANESLLKRMAQVF